eukprot:jgi/Mesvir1/28447/Mv15871-RA.2
MALSCLRAQTYVSQSTASPTASGVSVARAAPALRCPSLAKPKHRWTNADTSRLHVRHAYSQSSIVASADPGAAVPFPTLQGRETLSLRPQETTFDLNGLLLAHAAIRGDCEIILDALSKVDLSRKEPYAGVLKPVLNQFFALLEVHHDIEDNVMFPSLLQLPMPLPGIPAADLASLKPGPETAALNAATPFWTDMVDEHSALLRHLAWVQEGLSLFEVAERQDDPPSVIDIILGRAKQREAEQLARRQAAFDELKSRLTAAINQCLLPHLLKEDVVALFSTVCSLRSGQADHPPDVPSEDDGSGACRGGESVRRGGWPARGPDSLGLDAPPHDARE